MPREFLHDRNAPSEPKQHGGQLVAEERARSAPRLWRYNLESASGEQLLKTEPGETKVVVRLIMQSAEMMHGQDENSAWPQDAVDFMNRSERIARVLKNLQADRSVMSGVLDHVHVLIISDEDYSFIAGMDIKTMVHRHTI